MNGNASELRRVIALIADTKAPFRPGSSYLSCATAVVQRVTQSSVPVGIVVRVKPVLRYRTPRDIPVSLTFNSAATGRAVSADTNLGNLLKSAPQWVSQKILNSKFVCLIPVGSLHCAELGFKARRIRSMAKPSWKRIKTVTPVTFDGKAML